MEDIHFCKNCVELAYCHFKADIIELFDINFTKLGKDKKFVEEN